MACKSSKKEEMDEMKPKGSPAAAKAKAKGAQIKKARKKKGK